MRVSYKVAIAVFITLGIVSAVLFVGYLRALGGWSYGIGPR